MKRFVKWGCTLAAFIAVRFVAAAFGYDPSLGESVAIILALAASGIVLAAFDEHEKRRGR